MVDGFDHVLSQVDLRQNMSAVAEIEDAIGVSGSHGHFSTCECVWGVDSLPLETEPSEAIHFADMGLRLVFGRRRSSQAWPLGSWRTC
jgi:hypothetical protein